MFAVNRHNLRLAISVLFSHLRQRDCCGSVLTLRIHTAFPQRTPDSSSPNVAQSISVTFVYLVLGSTTLGPQAKRKKINTLVQASLIHGMMSIHI